MIGLTFFCKTSNEGCKMSLSNGNGHSTISVTECEISSPQIISRPFCVRAPTSFLQYSRRPIHFRTFCNVLVKKNAHSRGQAQRFNSNGDTLHFGLNVRWASKTRVGRCSSSNNRDKIESASSYHGWCSHFGMSRKAEVFVCCSFVNVGIMRATAGRRSRTLRQSMRIQLYPRLASQRFRMFS